MSGLLAESKATDVAPLEQLLAPEYPEAWRDIALCLYLQLRRLAPLASLASGQLAELALALTEGVRQELGGSQPYLPVGRAYELNQRDAQILREFDGGNHAELAKRHGVTARQIYAIVAAAQQRNFARRQTNLPLDSGAL